MIRKTRGIVLHNTKFSESRIISKIFTEELGMVSVMVNNSQGKKSKNKAAVLQPMSLLELVIYNKQNRGIQKVSEMELIHPYQTISTDIRKTSIVLFLADILRRAVHEEEVNKNLFQFIFHSMEVLDLKEDGLNNYPLFFLIQLSRHLGFFPSGEFSQSTPVFNMLEGRFDSGFPLHEQYLDAEEGRFFSALKWAGFDTFSDILIPKNTRKKVLDKTIDYFRLHLPTFSEIHSHEILAEVMA